MHDLFSGLANKKTKHLEQKIKSKDHGDRPLHPSLFLSFGTNHLVQVPL
jgi:hypothetical protein